jgi:hypothetical protein
MKFVGERRALAAIVLAFFFMYFTLAALQLEGPIARPFWALAGVYGLASFALIAGYFWARWYAVGVGLFGIIVAAVVTWQIGELFGPIMFFGGTHAFVALGLWGQAMSEPFDGQMKWREKFHMDENAVQRLGRSVIRAGVSLPFILLYALAPKPDALGLLAVVLATLGFRGLVQLKTWGVILLGAAGATLLFAPSHALVLGHHLWTVPALPIAFLLLAAAAPFVRPIARYVHAR